jgi:hypothetical protein
MGQPTADQALRRLDPLVGDWTFEVTYPNGDTWPGGGSATFAWHESGRHLVHRSTAALPEAPDNVSIIGCDGANDSYVQLYTDERDVCRIMQMSLRDGEWRLWRDGEPFSQRFTARISHDGDTIEGRWEMAEDGESFHTDFDIVYRRTSR